MTYTYDFPMNSGTATMAFFHGTKILLGLRGPDSDAHPNKWSLPGGFMNVGTENIYGTAMRETQEEISLSIPQERFRLFHVSSDPATDKRAHVINVCFITHLTDEEAEAVQANDDLADLKFLPVHEALDLSLAFDHADILRRAWQSL